MSIRRCPHQRSRAVQRCRCAAHLAKSRRGWRKPYREQTARGTRDLGGPVFYPEMLLAFEGARIGAETDRRNHVARSF